MHVVSVNVGLPRTILWKGRRVETGIFKEPVEGRRMVQQLNLDGDRQADLTVHGGPNETVYAYPIEHYDFWRDFLGETDLPMGAFGENLTVENLTEEDVPVGDRLQIGTTELVVTQPASPATNWRPSSGEQTSFGTSWKAATAAFTWRYDRVGTWAEGMPSKLSSGKRIRCQERCKIP